MVYLLPSLLHSRTHPLMVGPTAALPATHPPSIPAVQEARVGVVPSWDWCKGQRVEWRLLRSQLKGQILGLPRSPPQLQHTLHQMSRNQALKAKLLPFLPEDFLAVHGRLLALQSNRTWNHFQPHLRLKLRKCSGTSLILDRGHRHQPPTTHSLKNFQKWSRLVIKDRPLLSTRVCYHGCRMRACRTWWVQWQGTLWMRGAVMAVVRCRAWTV